MAGKSAPKSCWVTGLEYGLDTKGERHGIWGRTLGLGVGPQEPTRARQGRGGGGEATGFEGGDLGARK